MRLEPLKVLIPELVVMGDPVSHGAEARREEVVAALSAMPLLRHQAGIEQDTEVLRDGRAAHLEMPRDRVDGAIGLDEQIEHPATRRMTNCSEDVSLWIGYRHHAGEYT